MLATGDSEPRPPSENARRRQHRRAHRRGSRLLVALVAIAAIAFVGGSLTGAGREKRTTALTSTAVELPRGGREVFSDYRVVAFYGAPQDEQLGALGVGPPSEAARRLAEQARPYRRPDRPVLPAFELIATVASAHPGDDGSYRFRQPARVIRQYLDAARDVRGLLILDIQPGRASFMDEVRRLRRYLREPDVGLALDPEWHVAAPAAPGEEIGSVDARTVNQVSAFLAGIVERGDLPEKLLVVHQFTEEMIREGERLAARPGVALTINVDGFGDRANKVAKYRQLRPRGGAGGIHSGFKLFYEEDSGLMSPAQVMDLRPRPDLIVYE